MSSLLISIAENKRAIIESQPNIDPILAQSMAYNNVALSLDDATLKMILYSMAAKKTVLEIAQDSVAANNKIKKYYRYTEKNVKRRSNRWKPIWFYDN